jgi:hypothetical protein
MQKEGGLVKRAIFLATAARLAMLILVPMATAQGLADPGPGGGAVTFMETTMVNGSPVPIPSSGGPAILLPAAALLVGSGILTYAILRRR